MGFILESLYLFLIITCLVYYIILIQNSQSEWQILELSDKEFPSVSIIVPTLEEEHNIENCLTSLTNLDYPDFEIIVSDGGSSDRTVELANKYDVKVIIDDNLPEGWIGKSYGCHIGFKETKGDLLLFTDADTHHTPLSLRTAVSHLLATETDLFSTLPYQKAERWYEYLLSYFFFLSFLGGGPINNVNNPYARDSVMAIGQYLLFTRNAYNKIGGHTAVSKSLVEDLAFARVCKDKEMNLYFKSQTKLIQTRMYPLSFSDFFEGFRKTIYEGFWLLSTWRIMFVILWLIYMLVAPFFLIQSFFNQGNWLWWNYTIGIFVNLVLYLIYCGILYLHWRNKGDWKWYIFIFYPISMLVNLVIILIAFYYGFRGYQISWKNRYYSSEHKTITKKS